MTNSNRGIEVCVESLNEWQIKEIDFAGNEHHIKPLKFKDLIASNAQKIRWQEIVGKKASILDKENEAEPSTSGKNSSYELTETPSFLEPAAGPWSSVAKCLHTSMRELSLLLDTLQIMRSTPYLTPMNVFLLPSELEKRSNEFKAFHLFSKKRALFEVSKFIEENKSLSRSEESTLSKSQFYEELKRMRERWRIRKLENVIYGDLGYKIYGPKFAPNELFDIFHATKRSTEASDSNSPIRVQVPRDLERRTTLSVFILIDNRQNASNLFEVETPQDLSDQCKNTDWEKSLIWAQNSLICKDIFNQLVKDSVVQETICQLSSNFLLVSLFENFMLKIERRFYPFKDEEIKDVGITYLNRTLREMHMTDQMKIRTRPQPFVSLPLTTLPEILDLKGPGAFSSDEITSRSEKQTNLLKRFIGRSTHYLLVCQILNFLQEYSIKHPDPHLQWKWIRTSPTFSSIALSITNQGFETLGKVTCFIRITESEISVVNKEYQRINSYTKDIMSIRRAISFLISCFFLGCVNIQAKFYNWQILHVNVNALNINGNLTPTFYACNQSSTKHVFIQLHANGSPPQIFMKRSTGPAQANGNSPVDLSEFQRFNCERIMGTSIMRKIDNLFSIFSV